MLEPLSPAGEAWLDRTVPSRPPRGGVHVAMRLLDDVLSRIRQARPQLRVPWDLSASQLVADCRQRAIECAERGVKRLWWALSEFRDAVGFPVIKEALSKLAIDSRRPVRWAAARIAGSRAGKLAGAVAPSRPSWASSRGLQDQECTVSPPVGIVESQLQLVQNIFCHLHRSKSNLRVDW